MTDSEENIEIIGGTKDIVTFFERGLFDRVLITIGYNHLRYRKKLFSELKLAGVPFARSIHPSAIISKYSKIEEGCIIFPGCIVDESALIGANSILNAGCIVSHDSTIGSHSFLGPGVNISGFVKIGFCSFIGTGTTIIDNLSLGPFTQTGGGAVLTKSSEGGFLLVGNPAKKLRESDNV